MADSIKVFVDAKPVIRALEQFGKRAQALAARALTDTAKHARTLAVKDITSEWNLTQRTVRTTFKLLNATPQNPVAELSSKGRPIPLVEFRGTSWDKRKGRGVRYAVKKAGGRKVLRGAFIRQLAGGQRPGVGIRQGASRLPITERAVPGVYHAWRKRLDSELPQIAAFLRKRVDQLIALELQRRGR
jgi:hypothetical protein